jgi:hypothetical protein
MKQAALLVALGALLCVGVEALLLGPLAAEGLVYGAYGAALTVYLVAMVLAVTAAILSDVAALRQ